VIDEVAFDQSGALVLPGSHRARTAGYCDVIKAR
jgi:hypothetical protein